MRPGERVADATQIDEMLRGTPYTIDGRDAAQRFDRVAQKAESIRGRARLAAASAAEQARKVLPQFEVAVRSDLVAESNRMEGIRSSAPEIRDLARAKQDLLDMDVSAFLRFVKDDPRLLDSLGLYRAYAVADEWARGQLRPREYEIRGLHALVMPGLRTAGRYKQFENEIEGRDHVPIHPSEAPRVMGEMAKWFEHGTGDAALDAAVAHAWVAHIHPFEDGNGRMARLLANLALIQARYPPLLLRSREDRGPYLEALAASDDGDILPLYDLFVRSLRRVVKTMEHPNYEIYPDVVDGLGSEDGVPSRLIKTDRPKAGKEGTPCKMFARSQWSATTRSRSRWTSSLVRVLAG